MNENQYQNSTDTFENKSATAQTFAAGRSGETNTVQTYAAGGSGETNTVQTCASGRSGENGQGHCVKKLKAACMDLCNRFLTARLGLSYHITTRVIGGEQGIVSPENSDKNNIMVKQGDLDIRMADLVVGALAVSAMMWVTCTVKRFCCCKSKCKCKHK